jgi:formylmethanofuran dehydrogenase subunit B
MWNNKIEQTMNDVTCPSCGLSCDDLKIELADGDIKSIQNGCELARTFYTTAFEQRNANPMIDGRSASLDEALDQATALIRQAQSPLFAGLATDVNGMRSTLALADRCGATLDHLNGDAIFRNLRVVQDSGWFTTTFTEVRNRADLILLVGDQCLERFPRLVERVLLPEESLFTQANQRRIVLLGPWTETTLPDELAQLNPTLISTPMTSIVDVVGLLRGLIAGRAVNLDRLGEDTATALTQLGMDLQKASYSVVCWSAAELNIPHGELTILGLVDLVKVLNIKTRSAALPLAGTEADITTNQVCTWQLGYPLRTRLQRGYPEHDPLLNRWQDLLARGESDLLLWISSLSPGSMPPPSEIDTIVLGHPGMLFEKQPSIYIPVGVPGIDHPGHWYRSDGVCSLPLVKLRDSGLPSVSQIADQLNERLKSAADKGEGAARC